MRFSRHRSKNVSNYSDNGNLGLKKREPGIKSKAMKTTSNTVLISGGTAGIGLEIAKLLSTIGNKVIVTGRDGPRIEKALGQLKTATGIVSDVSKEGDVKTLVATLENNFPDLN